MLLVSERFKSEAKAAIGLRHERLMAVSDYGVTPDGATVHSNGIRSGCQP